MALNGREDADHHRQEQREQADLREKDERLPRCAAFAYDVSARNGK
jgi:hypothetical protein